MRLDILIMSMLIASVISYLVTKVNKKGGAFVTLLASLGALMTVFLYKEALSESVTFSMLEFKMTNYGWFFSVLMLTIYLATSFFNLYFAEKSIYPAAYNLLYTLSMAGVIGVATSKNFIALFVFWEVVVWSSMLIIPFGKSRKAAVKYFTFSLVGSFAMLYGMLVLYSKFGSYDINYVFNELSNYPNLATGVFFLVVLTALTKLGVAPLHTWVPSAYGDSPDGFTPVLSGAIGKMGSFVAFLIMVVFPSYKAFSSSLQLMGIPYQNYILMVLGAISIVVGTLMAIKEEDFKKLMAYASVSGAGYILIGLGLSDGVGLAGGLMHIFNHAIASATIFLSIAAVTYRTGTTKMSELGGLIHRMPVTFVVYLIAIISMAGIPPMSGFISKWLIFQSLARKGMVFIAFAAFFGSIGSFLYVFRPLSSVFLGQLSTKHEDLKEVPTLMLLPMVLLSGVTLFFGILPGSLLKFIGKIQSDLGLQAIEINGTKIMGTNGSLDPTVLTLIFGVGFVIALVIFLVLPKSKKVGLMDTYTAGEFIYTPELYHYSYDFYAPFKRLYDGKFTVVKWYDALVQRVDELGQFVSSTFFSYKPGVTVLWLSLVTIVMLWGGKL